MASNQALHTRSRFESAVSARAQPTSIVAPRTEEVIFAGDRVRLAGQVDYPSTAQPVNGYPMLFILPHAVCYTRDMYDPYVQIGLDRGFAVFRWDKRGTGRSGSSGRGSAVQDAVNAYEIALEQPDVDHRRAVILATGAGTALLGSSYGLFARVQNPYGALLIANMLDEHAILAINTRLQIVVGAKDWTPDDIYADAACAAHQRVYRHGASYYVAPDADRLLMTNKNGSTHLHAGARKVISGWLHTLLNQHALAFS